MTTKADIIRNTKTTQLEGNIFLHQYTTKGLALSVKTYRFGNRPADHVETSSGHCIGQAANKYEFIQVVFNHINRSENIKRMSHENI